MIEGRKENMICSCQQRMTIAHQIRGRWLQRLNLKGFLNALLEASFGKVHCGDVVSVHTYAFVCLSVYWFQPEDHRSWNCEMQV